MKTLNVGIIGGGLMGREVANALARWFVLENHPVRAELSAADQFLLNSSKCGLA